MLYATTRSDRDAYTAQHALLKKRGSDGGLYIPFRSPVFSSEQMDSFCQMRFSACVSELLNLQFGTHITSWDVDLSVGRYPVRLKQLPQRIVAGECWHNPAFDFSQMVADISQLLTKTSTADKGSWMDIGVRIAVLFGIYGELKRAGMADQDTPFDISVVSGDFSWPISAWYARKWGLPIGNIICCCNENSEIWNLFCHGTLRTDSVAIKTQTPDADVVIPESLERLVYAIGGAQETERYLHCVRRGETYYVDEPMLTDLRKGIFVTVISQPRVNRTIPSVFSTAEYILSPYDALAYSGLLDYRSRKGESRYALILSEKAPHCDLETIAQSLKITSSQLKDHLNTI